MSFYQFPSTKSSHRIWSACDCRRHLSKVLHIRKEHRTRSYKQVIYHIAMPLIFSGNYRVTQDPRVSYVVTYQTSVTYTHTDTDTDTHA